VATRSCGGGVALESPLDGGWGVVVAGPLGGGGGGSGHTIDPASEESGPASLAPSLGARVPVGRSRGSIRSVSSTYTVILVAGIQTLG
jgi:hypothetical protein